MRPATLAAALVAAQAAVSAATGAEIGVASWYGGRHHGRLTASGERFDQTALTAAHPTLPVRAGIRLRVTRLDTGASVVVRVNDRGPARWTGRAVDLSRAAAARLDMLDGGLARVRIERIP